VSRRSCVVAAAAKKKKTGKKKAPAAAGGFGAPTKVAVPTPAERLKRSMELYEQLLKERPTVVADDDNAEEVEAEDVLARYALTVRSTEPTAPAEFSDWVPVALANIVCGTEANPTELMPSVVGVLCREVYEAAAQGFPVLRKAPPQSIEYAFEPFNSFETQVYDGLLGRPEKRAAAAKVLGIEPSASPAELKKAHRGFMMKLHPDRFAGDEEGAAAAQVQMLEVQNAYETLGGGMGGAHGSWYAAIGGKGRVDFSGPLTKEQLGPLGKPRLAQEMDLNCGGWRAGIYPLEPEVTKEFVTRNIIRATSTSEL